MIRDIQEIKVFRVNLKEMTLAEARKQLDKMGYIVVNWERVDDISDRIYYAYCVSREGGRK